MLDDTKSTSNQQSEVNTEQPTPKDAKGTWGGGPRNALSIPSNPSAEQQPAEGSKPDSSEDESKTK